MPTEGILADPKEGENVASFSRPSSQGAAGDRLAQRDREGSHESGRSRAGVLRGGLTRWDSTVGRDAPHQIEPASEDCVFDHEEGLVRGDPRVCYLVGAELALVDVH